MGVRWNARPDRGGSPSSALPAPAARWLRSAPPGPGAASTSASMRNSLPTPTPTPAGPADGGDELPRVDFQPVTDALDVHLGALGSHRGQCLAEQRTAAQDLLGRALLLALPHRPACFHLGEIGRPVVTGQLGPLNR